ncbi:hypothetical protein GCM10028820_13970 [Tessaracoccus terricola]
MIQLTVPPADPSPSTTGGQIQNPAQVVARALTINPDDETTLEDWAARTQVSPEALDDDFRKEFGTSFAKVRDLLQHRVAGPRHGAVRMTMTQADPGAPASPATPSSELSPESPRTPW